MNKLSRLINEMDDEELRLLKKDLEAGNIEKLLNHRIRERSEADPNKVCPVCHSPVSEDSISLVFGPKDFRKKASFCAIDCLEYFISRIKQNSHRRENFEYSSSKLE
jgi:hypothetical protein